MHTYAYMLSRSHVFGALLIALAVGGCSAAVGDVEEARGAEGAAAQSELIGGDIAGTDVGTATLLVEGECTAARIGPNHILLAAHCVLALTPDGKNILPYLDQRYVPGARLEVTDANNASNARWIPLTVKRTHVHPAWLDVCRLGGCSFDQSIRGHSPPDVAIVETVESPPGTIAEVDTTPMRAGDAVILQGYGCEETAIHGVVSGRLKFARAKILPRASSRGGAVSGSYFETAGQHDNGLASLCPGDSGGPVYREGTPLRVVGVNAYYTFDDNSGVSKTNLHTRLDGGGYDVARWIRSVKSPSPATCEGMLNFDLSAFAGMGANVSFGKLAETVRLRCALVGSVPSTAELGEWAQRYASGMKPQAYASWLMASGSMNAARGAMTDAEFVSMLWRSGMGNELHPAWVSVYADLLASGEMTRDELAVTFANSDEYRTAVDPLWL